MCEIFNHYSTGLFTCLVSIRSRRQETLKNSYTGTTDVACMQEMGIVTNASCLFSKCPTKVIIIVQTSNFAVLRIMNHHVTGELKYFHVRRCCVWLIWLCSLPKATKSRIAEHHLLFKMSAGISALALTEDDVTKMLAATTHIGSDNSETTMEQYVWKKKTDGVGSFLKV